MDFVKYPLIVPIRVGSHWEHECYGRVKVIDIEINDGDKKDRIPYFIVFKPDSAANWSDPEAQGINGFIFQARKCL